VIEPRSPRELHLIARLRAGDADAVADLATNYGGDVFDLARTLLSNREDAADYAGCAAHRCPAHP
jgi:hypothetical protein